MNQSNTKSGNKSLFEAGSALQKTMSLLSKNLEKNGLVTSQQEVTLSNK